MGNRQLPIILGEELFLVASGVKGQHNQSDYCVEKQLILTNERHIKLQIVEMLGIFEDIDNNEEYLIKEKFRKFDKIHVLLFVLRRVRLPHKRFKTIRELTKLFKKDVRRISALIITNCESFDGQRRKDMLDAIAKEYPDICEFMNKGLFAVGFPTINNAPSSLKEAFQNSIAKDEILLQQLIVNAQTCCYKGQIIEESVIWNFLEFCFTITLHTSSLCFNFFSWIWNYFFDSN